jgi:hypothetical protein
VPEFPSSDPQTPVTAIFWEGLSVGDAVTRLLNVGFSDRDVWAIGVLTGRAPDLDDFFASHSIPAADSSYFNECFKDGAIVLIIRAPTDSDKRRALDVVRRSGGILPPSGGL